MDSPFLIKEATQNDEIRMTNEANDEIRMTNDEGMTKHESLREDHDPFAVGSMQFVREAPNAPPVYDLEERIARFREAVREFSLIFKDLEEEQ
jgi:hypothetical protein